MISIQWHLLYLREVNLESLIINDWLKIELCISNRFDWIINDSIIIYFFNFALLSNKFERDDTVCNNNYSNPALLSVITIKNPIAVSSYL